MPRLKGSADLLEDRRKRALVLLDSGYSLNEVGRRIGCMPVRSCVGAMPDGAAERRLCECTSLLDAPRGWDGGSAAGW
jgi:hypothetical protein